ncbi:hypothetical protein KC347_g6734 [Hortaea werneckii]|nr:hypothetical protein KC347_g6734 [Hortaea werneckii]
MPPSRSAWICASCARQTAFPSSASTQATRAFSASAAASQHQQTPSQDLPRWKQTPPAMKMPYRLRPMPKQPVFKVNEKPEVLDEMYDRFVGRVGEAAAKEQGLEGSRGRDMLPEEVKWLAITHKSFDHGRRGFNDRLAFLGKRILSLQNSLALLRSPTPSSTPRDPTSHPALSGLEALSPFAKNTVLSPTRLAKLAQTYGIDKVMRWKPKKSQNLAGSGEETVLAHTVYALIGALAMQRGGEVAGRVARERVLGPLGLR